MKGTVEKEWKGGKNADGKGFFRTDENVVILVVMVAHVCIYWKPSYFTTQMGELHGMWILSQ